MYLAKSQRCSFCIVSAPRALAFSSSSRQLTHWLILDFVIPHSAAVLVNEPFLPVAQKAPYPEYA